MLPYDVTRPQWVNDECQHCWCAGNEKTRHWHLWIWLFCDRDVNECTKISQVSGGLPILDIWSHECWSLLTHMCGWARTSLVPVLFFFFACVMPSHYLSQCLFNITWIFGRHEYPYWNFYTSFLENLIIPHFVLIGSLAGMNSYCIWYVCIPYDKNSLW